MDPKELAKLYEKKSAVTAAEATEKKAQMDAQKAEFQKRAEQGHAALRDVVIPYFQELVSSFPKGHFKFNSAAAMDMETHVPVAVSFKIGEGAEHFIEVIHGNVRIWWMGFSYPAQPAPGLNIAVVYSGNAEPFIAGPNDLTREKLGKLVEMAINEAK